MLYGTKYFSPIGELLLVAEENSLIGLWMENQKYYLGNQKEIPKEAENIPVLNQAKKWLDDYFVGKNPEIPKSLLKPQGTDFQKKYLEKALSNSLWTSCYLQ